MDNKLVRVGWYRGWKHEEKSGRINEGKVVEKVNQKQEKNGWKSSLTNLWKTDRKISEIAAKLVKSDWEIVWK